MNIPQEAIEAFDEAYAAKRKEIGRGIAEPGAKTRAGLEAALPHIRKMVAEEIRAEMSERDVYAINYRAGMFYAAQIAEGKQS